MTLPNSFKISGKIDYEEIVDELLHRKIKIPKKSKIGNEKCEIVGNITMDSFVLDITDIKKNKLKEGDHICLLDNSNIEHILKINNIISYELLTLMGDRLHRNY